MHQDRKRKHRPHGDSRDRVFTPERFIFAPHEIAFAGYSGAGKTTLLSAVIATMSTGHRVAYAKHDAHGFSMDREGKDSWQAAKSGASQVYISDSSRYALLGNGRLDKWNSRYLLNDADVVLVESHKHSPIPKILVLDREANILDEVVQGRVAEIIAYATRDDMSAAARVLVNEVAKETPVFPSSDAEGIAGFVLDYLEKRVRSAPLYGLVSGRGEDTRMRPDKTTLEYRGMPSHAYELLEGVCDRSFICLGGGPSNDPALDGLQQIRDRFGGIGPMGGILSAMHAHPEAAWLVLGNDLPFINAAILDGLVTQRDPLLQATCYVSPHDGLPEPLCAVYEPRYRRRLHQFLADGEVCPRTVLISTRAKRLVLPDDITIGTIDDQGE